MLQLFSSIFEHAAVGRVSELSTEKAAQNAEIWRALWSKNSRCSVSIQEVGTATEKYCIASQSAYTLSFSAGDSQRSATSCKPWRSPRPSFTDPAVVSLTQA